MTDVEFVLDPAFPVDTLLPKENFSTEALLTSTPSAKAANILFASWHNNDTDNKVQTEEEDQTEAFRQPIYQDDNYEDLFDSYA